MLNQWEIEDFCKSIGKYSQFMAQMTWFSSRMVLFRVRTVSDIIWGNVLSQKPKRGVNRHFHAKLA